MIPTVLSIVTQRLKPTGCTDAPGVWIDPSIYDLPSIQGEEIGGLASQEIKTSNLDTNSYMKIYDMITYDRIWSHMIIPVDHIRFKCDFVEILGGAGKRFTMQN